MMFPDAHPAPNIHDSPHVYEIENEAADPDRLIEAAMWKLAPWAGRVVLDLGAGTGFHIERFHRDAAEVIAVEPHEPSRLRAAARIETMGLTHASVIAGSAEHIPVPDASVDVVHTRFAYFFGTGCEPGLAELRRVIRPGGTTFIIDNELDSGLFASWLRRLPRATPDQATRVRHFWRAQGFEHVCIESQWHFMRREDLIEVIRLEFPPDLSAQIVTEHAELTVDYHYALYYRHF